MKPLMRWSNLTVYIRSSTARGRHGPETDLRHDFAGAITNVTAIVVFAAPGYFLRAGTFFSTSCCVSVCLPVGLSVSPIQFNQRSNVLERWLDCAQYIFDLDRSKLKVKDEKTPKSLWPQFRCKLLRVKTRM